MSMVNNDLYQPPPLQKCLMGYAEDISGIEIFGIYKPIFNAK
jgi:hypothetical protein